MKSAEWNACRDLTPARRSRAVKILEDFEDIKIKYRRALALTTIRLLSECFSQPRQKKAFGVCDLYIPDETLSIEELLGHLYGMSKPISHVEGHNEQR
jgi:hypothetical protein